MLTWIFTLENRRVRLVLLERELRCSSFSALVVLFSELFVAVYVHPHVVGVLHCGLRGLSNKFCRLKKESFSVI